MPDPAIPPISTDGQQTVSRRCHSRLVCSGYARLRSPVDRLPGVCRVRGTRLAAAPTGAVAVEAAVSVVLGLAVTALLVAAGAVAGACRAQNRRDPPLNLILLANCQRC